MELTEVRHATQYDGTNSAAILAILQEDPNETWSIFQEVGNTLTVIQSNSMDPEHPTYHTLYVGWWVFHWNLVEGTWLWWMTDEIKQAKYRE